MNSDLLNETVSAYFAGHVDAVMGDFVRITDREFDPLTDTCTVWTTPANKDISHSMFALQERIRMRTGVSGVSVYATSKGFSIVLSGCMNEYRRWSRKQLNMRGYERLVYILLGALAACLVFYLCNR